MNFCELEAMQIFAVIMVGVLLHIIPRALEVPTDS